MGRALRASRRAAGGRAETAQGSYRDPEYDRNHGARVEGWSNRRDELAIRVCRIHARRISTVGKSRPVRWNLA